MKIITLYKYQRADGGVTVSPNKPECDCTEMYRLVTDAGKLVTNGEVEPTGCIDVDNTDGWYEIDEPVEEEKEVKDTD
jgi:hypothetical protein